MIHKIDGDQLMLAADSFQNIQESQAVFIPLDCELAKEILAEDAPASLDISTAITDVLALLNTLKPNDRSKQYRHFAVAINDLEHVLAYVDRWIVFDQ